MSNLESAINNLVSRIDALSSRLDGLEKNLASGAAHAPACGASAGAAASGGPTAAYVGEYQDLVDEHIKPLVKLSEKFGTPELKKQIAALDKAIGEQKKLLEVASASSKPSSEDTSKLLEPISKLIGEITSIRDSNRPSSQFNHLSTISEGIGALAWVVVEPKPGPHVDEARASSEFYSNKLLVQYKGKDQDQLDWVNHWNTFLKELSKYIKKHHTTGLAWNPKGGNALSASASAPKAAGGPPPPPAGGPPPPPPPSAPLTSGGGGAATPDMTAVFSALNKGTDITSGLKKVQDKDKTKYRKPEERVSVVPSGNEKKAAKEEKSDIKIRAGTPRIALEGNKWIVEFQDNNKNIVIDKTEAKQTLYIYGCKNSVVQVKGKINTICLDSSIRTGVVFENVIATCEVVSCKSVEIQVTGKVPAVAIDKTQGVQLYLSKDSLQTEIVTSKSDQMNILVPVEGQQDPVELPLPEQFKTMYVNGKLVTTTVAHG